MSDTTDTFALKIIDALERIEGSYEREKNKNDYDLEDFLDKTFGVGRVENYMIKRQVSLYAGRYREKLKNGDFTIELVKEDIQDRIVKRGQYINVKESFDEDAIKVKALSTLWNSLESYYRHEKN